METAHFLITDLRDRSVRDLDLPYDSRDMPGWNKWVMGWSIGPRGSGAPIELDEPLGECRIGIFPASNHVLLWGTAKELPEIWMLRGDVSVDALVPIQPEHWTPIDRAYLAEMALVGNVRLRFDRRPLRLGNHVLEMR
jgi:hypothetical protein